MALDSKANLERARRRLATAGVVEAAVVTAGNIIRDRFLQIAESKAKSAAEQKKMELYAIRLGWKRDSDMSVKKFASDLRRTEAAERFQYAIDRDQAHQDAMLQRQKDFIPYKNQGAIDLEKLKLSNKVHPAQLRRRYAAPKTSTFNMEPFKNWAEGMTVRGKKMDFRSARLMEFPADHVVGTAEDGSEITALQQFNENMGFMMPMDAKDYNSFHKEAVLEYADQYNRKMQSAQQKGQITNQGDVMAGIDNLQEMVNRSKPLFVEASEQLMSGMGQTGEFNPDNIGDQRVRNLLGLTGVQGNVKLTMIDKEGQEEMYQMAEQAITELNNSAIINGKIEVTPAGIIVQGNERSMAMSPGEFVMYKDYFLQNTDSMGHVDLDEGIRVVQTGIDAVRQHAQGKSLGDAVKYSANQNDNYNMVEKFFGGGDPEFHKKTEDFVRSMPGYANKFQQEKLPMMRTAQKLRKGIESGEFPATTPLRFLEQNTFQPYATIGGESENLLPEFDDNYWDEDVNF